jgi:hypothetical protein
MNRREAVSTVAVILGGTVVGSNLLLTGCKQKETKTSPADFSAEDIALLDEVAETIIPETSTPGAKAAKVGEFMKVMVTDCYDEKKKFCRRNRCRPNFMNLDAARKECWLRLIKNRRNMLREKTGRSRTISS